MIEDLRLKAITFQPFRDFEGAPTDRRARVFQRAERKSRPNRSPRASLRNYSGQASSTSHSPPATSSIRLRHSPLKAFPSCTFQKNYCDDLEAKDELPTEVIERLKACNVLFDRHSDGEYFQLYIQTLANRFFFEIVERRGATRGSQRPTRSSTSRHKRG